MDTAKHRNQILKLTITGLLFVGTYCFRDDLFEHWLIFGSILIFSGCWFIFLFISALIRRNKLEIILGCIIWTPILGTHLIASEIFKSEKILEATLIDDLSTIHLTLRKNQKFEVLAKGTSGLFLHEESFHGRYSIKNNDIIFLDKPYENGFIPDTVSIVGDKVILRNDGSGNPITDFASYFAIKKNNIKRTTTTE